MRPRALRWALQETPSDSGQLPPCRAADHAGLDGQPAAAELGPQPAGGRNLQEPLFPGPVAIGRAAAVGRRRQAIQRPGRGQLQHLQIHLRAGAADHQGQVVRRAGGHAQRPHLAAEKGGQGLVAQAGLLVFWKKTVLLEDPPPLAMKRK